MYTCLLDSCLQRHPLPARHHLRISAPAAYLMALHFRPVPRCARIRGQDNERRGGEWAASTYAGGVGTEVSPVVYIRRTGDLEYLHA